MKTFFTLAWRNIWRNKRRTLITVSAIMFAVLVAIFSQSLNRGSHDLMIENMARFSTGFLQVQDYRFEDEPSLDNTFYLDDELKERVRESHSGIQMLLPRIETFMLAANDHSTRGSMVTGIEPELEQEFSGIRDRKTGGRFFEPGEQAVVVSEGLAQRLELGIGDTLALIGQGRFGMSASGLFEIAGTVNLPIREMNDAMVYMHLEVAQELLSAEGYVTGLLISPDRVRNTDRIADAIRPSLNDDELRVFTWQELMPELLDFIEFDIAGAYVMSGILYVVIGFGFFGTILMMTLERLREFGMLISVGMKRLSLAAVLFIETLMISIIGVLGGLFLTWLVLLYFHYNPIELTGSTAEAITEMGWDAILPVSFAPELFYMQGLIIFLLSLIIFLYPLTKIIRLNVLEAARS
ncbi:MAG: ABC transporter permease [Balneolaceae bacterium]|nr:ABC transporter permease [Balneolaceae bacterium]